MDDESEYDQDENDLEAWEEEQVFQDREYEDDVFDDPDPDLDLDFG